MRTFLENVNLVLARFESPSGFVEGDYVKFKKGWEKNEAITSRGATSGASTSYSDRITAIQQLVEQQQGNIRVSAIHSVRNFSGVSDPSNYIVDIAYETAAGMPAQVLTVPAEVLELITDGNERPNPGPRHNRKTGGDLPNAPDMMYRNGHHTLKYTAPDTKTKKKQNVS